MSADLRGLRDLSAQAASADAGPARLPALSPSPKGLAFVLGALAMFGPFAIDTIFPAFPALGADFGIGATGLQQTISIYLIAYAVMSLFHGPLSDAFGRKPMIIGGALVFAAASVGAALAQSFAGVLAFRALQGASSGVGMIVGRAVIRDCLSGAAAQRLMSHVSMIFGIAPAVAPIVGGLIIAQADWRYIFWFLAAFAVVLTVLTTVALPETHPVEQRIATSLRKIFAGSWGITRDPLFSALTAAITLNFAALFLYISAAPAVVLNLMGLGTGQFGWFFIPTISGMVLGAALTGRLAGRFSTRSIVKAGFAICGVAAVASIITMTLVGQPLPRWAVAPIALNAIGVAMVFPLLTIKQLDRYPTRRGAASSAQAFTSLVFHSAVAGLIAPAVQHDARLMALTAALFTALGFAAWRLSLRLADAPPWPGPTQPKKPSPLPAS